LHDLAVELVPRRRLGPVEPRHIHILMEAGEMGVSRVKIETYPIQSAGRREVSVDSCKKALAHATLIAIGDESWSWTAVARARPTIVGFDYHNKFLWMLCRQDRRYLRVPTRGETCRDLPPWGNLSPAAACSRDLANLSQRAFRLRASSAAVRTRAASSQAPCAPC